MSVVSRLQNRITPNFTASGDAAEGSVPQRANSSKMALSLTLVAFIFGSLIAVQLRAVQTVRANRDEQARSIEVGTQKVKEMQRLMEVETKNSALLQERLAALQDKIKSGDAISRQQSASLSQEIKKLQIAAGLSPITGQGIVIKLSDNPNAAQDAVGTFLPGLVHDFDVLQVVNELRAAKADAISVNGTRITGYTPIRCVGPVIYVNWEPAAAPFVVEAVGDSNVLYSAMKMPGGILDSLKHQDIGIKIGTSKKLTLPASKSLPTLNEAQTQPKSQPKPQITQ